MFVAGLGASFHSPLAEDAAPKKDDATAVPAETPKKKDPFFGDHFAMYLETRGGSASIDTIRNPVTSGAQQGLDLAGRIFLEKGDRILVESPTYVGALTAWFGSQPRYVAVPMDSEGMIVDQIDDLVKGNGPIKFAYTVVNFQNPTGVTLTSTRREQLINKIHQMETALIEDDPPRTLPSE
jgi:DNA-binding transcriptional MocR family regulator